MAKKMTKKQQELQKEWDALQAKWASAPKFGRAATAKLREVNTSKPVDPKSKQSIPSLGSWVTGPVSSPTARQYTGDKMIGISQMAKSNAVPVFTTEHILEITRMRR